LDFDEDEKEKKNETGTDDPSVWMSQELYCDVLSTLDEECWESNIAEMWGFDSSVISNLNRNDILKMVNSKTSRYLEF